MVKDLAKRFYFYAVLAFIYLPIFVMIVLSFNSSRFRGLWKGFTLEWYVKLLSNENVMSVLFTTILVALLAALISTVVGTMAAIGLFNSRPAFKNAMISLTYLPMVNSDIVTGVSLMILFTAMKMTLGFGTLLFAHVAFCVPYVIFSVLPKMYQVNRNVYEAALDLGANERQAFYQVILPEIMPAVISGFLICVTLSVDDFMISFFTTGSGVQNLSIMIYTMTKRGINPEIYALSTIVFTVVMALLAGIHFKPKKARQEIVD